MKFGASDYRTGSRQRLGESQTLLINQQYAGSVYLVGRGVESMLRALIWKRDVDIQRGRKSLDTGHDLKQLLSEVAKLGLLAAGQRDDEFKSRVNRVSTMWKNDLRFASDRYLETWWRDTGKIAKGRNFPFVARAFFNDCSYIIKRGDELCRP